MKVIVHTDGGSRGNPGDAGAGAVVLDPDGSEIAAVAEFLGQATNNEAEYRALMLGLKTAHKLGADDVVCRLDSELVVKQINGQYKVKKAELQVLHGQVKRLANSFDKFKIVHVRREKNKRADDLANQAMDAAVQGVQMTMPEAASLDDLAACLYEVASTLTDPSADGIRRALQQGAIEVQGGLEVGLRTINAALTMASHIRCVPEDTRDEMCSLTAEIAERWNER